MANICLKDHFDKMTVGCLTYTESKLLCTFETTEAAYLMQKKNKTLLSK